jgi:protein-tyrosine phosphatase
MSTRIPGQVNLNFNSASERDWRDSLLPPKRYKLLEMKGWTDPPLNKSDTHPIRVDWVDPLQTGTSGQLGMTLCPGRRQVSNSGKFERDLTPDMEGLKAAGVDVLVCTIEHHEFAEQKIEAYFDEAQRLGIEVLWFPIPDHGAPSDMAHARSIVSEIVTLLRYGKKVVIHCRAGIGRTGCMAACVMVRLGYLPKEAISVIRTTRARTVDTIAQERFVYRFGPPAARTCKGFPRHARKL